MIGMAFLYSLVCWENISTCLIAVAFCSPIRLRKAWDASSLTY